MNGGNPLEAWARTKAQHPKPGELVDVARQQLDELATFLERQALITIPAGEQITVAPTPDFYRWSFASMWTPGPFEAKPTRAYYYLTDVDPSWSRERQDEHLRDYNYPTLWSISIHEVYPGHFLQFQHLRRVESKVRKSIMFAPASFVEGWAHYCEEMMMDAGFGRQDYSVKLGQLAEALIRLARFIVCIRMHAEDMSVEQGVRFFRDEAFMEEGSARREAERGTFDPMYLVYSVGKLMLMKLRRDYKQQQGKAFSLRTFHDTLLGQGTAPFWLHRQLMLGGPDGATPAICSNEPMPLYEYQCDACGRRFELIRKFSDPPLEKCPHCGGTVRKLFRRRRFSSRAPAFTSPTTRKRIRRRRRSPSDVEIRAAASKDKDKGEKGREEREGEKSEKSDKAEKTDKSEKSDEERQGEKATARPMRRQHRSRRRRRRRTASTKDGT